ncbi:hypothetical protein J7L05_07905 [bacterium]|nr:hypothetical protein [bacterium]
MDLSLLIYLSHKAKEAYMSYMKFLLSEVNDSVDAEDVYDELHAFLSYCALDAFLGADDELESLIRGWLEALEALMQLRAKFKVVPVST